MKIIARALIDKRATTPVRLSFFQVPAPGRQPVPCGRQPGDCTLRLYRAEYEALRKALERGGIRIETHDLTTVPVRTDDQTGNIA